MAGTPPIAADSAPALGFGGTSSAAVSSAVFKSGLRAYVRAVQLEPGFHSLSLLPPVDHAMASGQGLPLVHIGAPLTRALTEFRDMSGRVSQWLRPAQDRLVLSVQKEPIRLLLTAYDSASAGERAIRLELRQLAADETAIPSPSQFARYPSVVFAFVEENQRTVRCEVVTFIRDAGEVRFIDADWVGRFGRGYWIEAFAVIFSGEDTPDGIEYRGLSAAGVDTSWIASGSRCGTPGTNVPLIGFAVRQRAQSRGRRFNCEYVGYFSSGHISGLSQNGAPCRSPLPDDPLEGIRFASLRARLERKRKRNFGLTAAANLPAPSRQSRVGQPVEQ